jgi:hypothetical protein
VRVLCPIVQSFVLAMLDAKVHLCPRRGVGSELVGDHDARRRVGGLEELRHEPARRAAVSSTLNQNVEHEAVLIYRTPQPVWLSGDRNDDFVEMPFVAARRSPLADLVRERLAELHRSLAHRLVAHANAPLREHLLDHAKAQGKPEIEPDRMKYDDLRRKSMAAIEGITSG